MASLALAAFLLQLLSAHALADEGCASYGTCQADEDENTALLQRSATQKAQVTEHSHAKTTETTTLTCYPNYAADTCGGTMKCFQDTTGCSSTGGGVCCKAAGNGAGLEQCKFCGDDVCGPCPGDVPPAPTPTLAPETGSYCGNCPSTGLYNGYCPYGQVCGLVSTMMVGSCSMCQDPPASPVAGELGAPCGHCGSTGMYYGECNKAAGLVCINGVPGAPPGACPVCQGGFMHATASPYSALEESSATEKTQVTEHSHAKTTETKTLTCYPNYAAATCGATMKCFQDTTGCSSSGAGVCCKAAGNGAGLEQCKFCGDETCGPCPDDPTPTPTPTPASGSYCGNCPSTGLYNGYCPYGEVCGLASTMMVGSCSMCQSPPANPVSGELGAPCGHCGSTGMYYGECNKAAGLVCINGVL